MGPCVGALLHRSGAGNGPFGRQKHLVCTVSRVTSLGTRQIRPSGSDPDTGVIVIILGLILLILGLVLGISILTTIGGILITAGSDRSGGKTFPAQVCLAQ